MSVTYTLARRFMTEVDRRLVWKFAVNFGVKGCLSVERDNRRLRKGVHFPPFLFISIINSCAAAARAAGWTWRSAGR